MGSLKIRRIKETCLPSLLFSLYITQFLKLSARTLLYTPLFFYPHVYIWDHCG